MEQARYISTAELFRLFVIDSRDLPQDDIKKLSDPDSLHSDDETLRSMAEQYTYIQDLLRDFTRRRAWTDARILMPDGSVLVAPQFNDQIIPDQQELGRKAVEAGHFMFGPLRDTPDGIVIDMAEPLFEVLGADEPKAVAVLLLSVPMDKTLATFLARNGEQMEVLLPRIVNMGPDGLAMALSRDGRIALEQVKAGIEKVASLPFERRKALNGASEVYSMGGVPNGLSWMFVLETPATEVDALIDKQTFQIYGLGILGSIGFALLTAWFWAGRASRRHKAQAAYYRGLWELIDRQKLMLDSVNSSFQAGLALIDEQNSIEMCNPAFKEIFGIKQKIGRQVDLETGKETGSATPLKDIIPMDMAITLMENMALVRTAGEYRDIEMDIPKDGSQPGDPGSDRLFRISLFPFSFTGIGETRTSGCVVVMKDITLWRRQREEKERLAEIDRQRREKERKRQEALIATFVHAIESVDAEHLVGDSDKMSNLSALLADKLELTDDERQTLMISAKLSQVGKLFVPHEILTKGQLTDEEKMITRRIPEFTDNILRNLYFDLPVRETVGLMRERVDGSGRPKGLTGNEISLCGRTLAVVDSFVAMTGHRSYRKPMSIEEAIENLFRDSGYDPKIVSALEALSRDQVAKIIGAQNAPDK